MYVAESGRGGDHATAKSCFDSAEGFACTGRTGAVTRIGRLGPAPHRQRPRVVRAGQRRQRDRPARRVRRRQGRLLDQRRPDRLRPAATRRELVLRDPTLVAEDPISALYGRLLKVKSHDRVVPIADAWAFENGFNPDAQVGNPIVDSNPVDVLVDAGAS